MRTSTTLDSLTDSIPAPLSGTHSKETLGALAVVHTKGAPICHCCGCTEDVATDQYGESLCTECQERASGDTWFDTGGG
jgi:hypothetical protein